jgi:molecular chaperone DnaK (HSP70)
LLIDVTPLSLGVESSGGVMAPIIPKNTTIPVTKSKTFSTNHDNQESVKVKIFEGERPLTRDNHCLGTFEMHNIPPMPRAQPRIEVTFELDANGILTVKAEEKGSGKSGSLTITNDQGRLTPEQIEAMLSQAKAFEEDDRIRAELLDWRNSLENYGMCELCAI